MLSNVKGSLKLLGDGSIILLASLKRTSTVENIIHYLTFRPCKSKYVLRDSKGKPDNKMSIVVYYKFCITIVLLLGFHLEPLRTYLDLQGRNVR